MLDKLQKSNMTHKTITLTVLADAGIIKDDTSWGNALMILEILKRRDNTYPSTEEMLEEFKTYGELINKN